MISEDNLCGFLDGADSFGGFLQLNGILVNMVDMPATVQGFTYLSLKEEYHIVINENLSLGTKQKYTFQFLIGNLCLPFDYINKAF